MVDPVLTPGGKACERTAVEDWIEEHGTDPFTQTPLKVELLRPAPDLVSAIQMFQFQQLLGRRRL